MVLAFAFECRLLFNALPVALDILLLLPDMPVFIGRVVLHANLCKLLLLLPF
jgi:hypothetical protein